MDMGMSKHSTPVGKVEKVDGKALYRTWFSFLMYSGQMGGTWSLSFNYTIGSSNTQSLIVREKAAVLETPITETYIGWFKDRHCTGAVSLPLTKSCGIGCGTGAGNMAGCWNGGLGLFIYNAAETGDITKDVARSEDHFLLFDAQSKELARAFLLSLPSDASGQLSIKVTGYKVANGITANETESNIPELASESVHHTLNAFHILTIEGVVIENQAKSYAGFASTTYKSVPADLAPSNISAVNYTGGTTVKFAIPANAGNAKSNLTGYKVKFYKVGELQDAYTTISNNPTLNAVDVAGLTASNDYSFTVTALYPGSAVEVESASSNVIDPSITSVAIPVDDYPADNKWLQSFTYNNESYYLSVAYPKTIGVGSQTVRAYINKQVNILEPFPLVGDGFIIEATPFMRSMGHGSSGNTALEWNATSEVYEGTLNFSMEGDWRVNLKIIETATNSVVAGVDLNANGDNSTHYWDFYPTKAVSTGVAESNSAEISVYPTVSHGDITIKVPLPATVKIFDLSGRPIESHELSESQTINLNVQSGIYFVLVESADKKFSQKVIIRK